MMSWIVAGIFSCALPSVALGFAFDAEPLSRRGAGHQDIDSAFCTPQPLAEPDLFTRF
jgi:hypothetical protein